MMTSERAACATPASRPVTPLTTKHEPVTFSHHCRRPISEPCFTIRAIGFDEPQCHQAAARRELRAATFTFRRCESFDAIESMHFSDASLSHSDFICSRLCIHENYAASHNFSARTYMYSHELPADRLLCEDTSATCTRSFDGHLLPRRFCHFYLPSKPFQRPIYTLAKSRRNARSFLEPRRTAPVCFNQMPNT
jgi:hypothetical protein